MLTRFRCENFKALASLDVGFEQFTVLVGPNGCGKSTVLEGVERMALALAAAATVAGGPPHEAVVRAAFGFEGRMEPSLRAWLTCGRKVPVLLEIHADEFRWMSAVVSSETPTFAPVLECGHGDEIEAYAPPAYSPNHRRWSRFQSMDAARRPDGDKVEWRPESNQPFVRMQPLIGRAERVRFDADQLATPAVRESLSAAMDARGFGLPVLLADMALNRPAAHAALVGDLRRVVPGVRALKSPPAEVKREGRATSIGYGLQIEFETGAVVDAANISEGTLLTLGLLARVHASEGPSVILLDDIDRGLHPAAQARLCTCIRALLVARPDLQVIATSHSPYILDHFQIAEVRVMGFGPDGLARVRPLAEHPEAERMKGFLKTGEFWATVGEDWVGRGDA